MGGMKKQFEVPPGSEALTPWPPLSRKKTRERGGKRQKVKARRQKSPNPDTV